ncbi:MAG: type II secretion system F family protein [Gammaproteobacteria bacterium]|nr:type II secretion system F family protein [Gammaproteobacteria bacterium]
MTATPLLIAAGCAALALIATWLAAQSMRRRARIRKRIDPIAELLTPDATETESATEPQRKKRRKSGPVEWLDSRYPLSGGVRTASVALAVGGLAFGVVWTGLAFFGLLSGPLAGAASAGIGAGLAWQVGEIMEKAKRTEFSNRFIIVLEDFQRMVRHGIATGQALASVAAAADEPAKTSLARIVLETGFGVAAAVAIESEAQRVKVSELSMLAAIVGTQSATGGNLSESLENLANMVRERRDTRSRMRASTAESRITIIVLTLIPGAAVGIQAMSQPELIDVLLGEGRHLLGIGVILIAVGLGLAAMIIRSVNNE